MNRVVCVLDDVPNRSIASARIALVLDGYCGWSYAVARSLISLEGEISSAVDSSETTPHQIEEKQTGPVFPSVAYKQAIDSLVYTLSELMFGSLLASYVLGFIGLLAVRSVDPSYGTVGILWPILQYIAVSISYAYLTAGLYVSYHAGILTMYHMPLARLRFDFLFALFQAISFGLSMLFPWTFPILLGLIVLVAARRQHKEHDRLVGRLYTLCRVGRAPELIRDEDDVETVSPEFRNKFQELLTEKGFSELSVWRKVRFRLQLFAVLLVIVGTAIAYKSFTWQLWIGDVSSFIHTNWNTSNLRRFPDALIACESAIVLVGVFLSGHKVLHDRATFLYNREKLTTKMDSQFGDLLRTLREWQKKQNEPSNS